MIHHVEPGTTFRRAFTLLSTPIPTLPTPIPGSPRRKVVRLQSTTMHRPHPCPMRRQNPSLQLKGFTPAPTLAQETPPTAHLRLSSQLNSNPRLIPKFSGRTHREHSLKARYLRQQLSPPTTITLTDPPLYLAPLAHTQHPSDFLRLKGTKFVTS